MLLLGSVAIWLHRARIGGMGIALLETALLAYFAQTWLYPALSPLVSSIVLTALLVSYVQVRKRLLDGDATEDELKAIDKEIKAIVNDAAEYSKESPEPALSELWTDIYIEANA